MANKKITDLDELTTLDSSDLVEVVDDPGGTPASHKMTMLNLVKAAMGLASTEEFQLREVIHDETLSEAGRFDVSSIPQDYDHLELFLVARSSTANAGDSVYMFFNNDTTVANYHRQRHGVDNGSPNDEEAAQSWVGAVAGGGSPANAFGTIRIFIPCYTDTNMLRQAHCDAMSLMDAASMVIWHVAMVWEDGGATAINRITLQPDGYDTDKLAAGSRLQIIGVKSSG